MPVPVKVLDHGYLGLIESWGSDDGIVAAARMSTQKGFLGWGPFDCPECMHESGEGRIKEDCKKCGNTGAVPGDEKLLRYLYEHNHSSPFEAAGMTIEVQAPIFVFREWHRHRTQSYNEMSARYAPLPDLHYVPTIDRLMMNAGGTNRQAGTIKDSESLTEQVSFDLLTEEREFNMAAERFYQKKLKAGVPKELARTHLGVSRYSRMRASANLRNWLAFLTLRLDPAAQWEIRKYAEQVGVLIANSFPRTWELFAEGKS